MPYLCNFNIAQKYCKTDAKRSTGATTYVYKLDLCLDLRVKMRDLKTFFSIPRYFMIMMIVGRSNGFKKTC